MSAKTFNLSLPSEIVEMIDNRAKLEYTTRSDYIKRAIIAKLKADGAYDKTKIVLSPEEAQRARLKKSSILTVKKITLMI